MDIAMLRSFFLWCTIINAGLLMLTFLMFVFAGGMIYRMHSKWFPMPRETFTVILYLFMGIYKIGLFVFCLIPYIALLIVG